MERPTGDISGKGKSVLSSKDGKSGISGRVLTTPGVLKLRGTLLLTVTAELDGDTSILPASAKATGKGLLSDFMLFTT